MAARIIAQLIIQAGSILTRAVFTAYQQALRNAKAGGAASTATAVVRKKMAADEAYKILNIEKVPGGVSSKVINEHYEKFFNANDPAKGGSFYLQSKIFRAKEALLKEAFDAVEKDQSSSSPPPSGAESTSTNSNPKASSKDNK